jgi:polysaccharide pyruvyl transferase WcaK-like protein
MRSITVRDEIARRTLQACTAKQVAVVPDPAFMLEPAPAAEARRHLATLGIPAGRPPIGVVVRRWFHKRGGFLPHQLRSRLGLDRGEGAAPMRDFIGVIAGALTRLARRLDTGVLLLPSYHSAHEGDLDACNMLAARIEGAEVHVARITSPTLYKAVTGELRLLISARMHPLILAAGMGVPLMGIGYNSKFTGCMESLGIADQLLWFDDFTGDPGGEMLERRALAALASPVDLVARASALAQRSREATAKLLDLIE